MKGIAKNAPEHIEVHENKELGIRCEGRYSQSSWSATCWVLTHWRIRPGPEGHPNLGKFSEWYKVHGNQRRSCAGFQLVIDKEFN